MGWRFKIYESEDGESQPKRWYERQLRAVRAKFDAQLFQLALRKNAPESVSFRVPGYSEVTGIAFEIESDAPEGVTKFMTVGFWQGDSSNFVILLICEETAGGEEPPLYQALELKKACDSGKGRIYDHIPADEPND